MSKKRKSEKIGRTPASNDAERFTSADIIFRLPDGRVLLVEPKSHKAGRNEQLDAYTQEEMVFQTALAHYRILDKLPVEASTNFIACLDPPKNAQRILSLFLRTDEREAVIGDLAEKYRVKYTQFGERKAKRWIYLQVARSIVPFVVRLCGKIGWLILGAWLKKYIS